jgi:hypothetical protein
LTSPIICWRTARTKVSRVPASSSVAGSSFAGIAEAKCCRPPSGVHAQPGGNGSTNACHSGSNACISDAKRTAPFRCAQYNGLIPTGSRAATKRPSRPAITNANMPLSSPSPATPRSSIRVGGHDEDLVLDGASAVAEVEVARLAVVADPPRGVVAVDGPGRQRADDLGPVERQRARRLGEELVVTEEHPEPADGRVEGGEAVARGVGEALGGREVDLALVAEHAVAADADRRRVQPAGSQLAVAGADHHVAGERDQPRDLRPVGREPGWHVGRHLVRPRLAHVAAERGLRQHQQPRALLAGARGMVRDARERRVDVAARAATASTRQVSAARSAGSMDSLDNRRGAPCGPRCKRIARILPRTDGDSRPMALLELVRPEPDWLAALEVAFTPPPGATERRQEPADGEVPEESRRISDELLWLRHAIEEPETSGLTPLPESAAVGMWDAEEGCLVRLCRLRDRKVLDAAGFLLHESEDEDALLADG